MQSPPLAARARLVGAMLVSFTVLAAACGDDTDVDPPGSGGGTSASTVSSSASTSGPSASSGATSSSTGAGGGSVVWATWTKHPEREFRGQVFDGAWVASDPCVLHDGETYRMFYTCVAGATVGGLCQVTSPDGIDWSPAPSIDPAFDGLVARSRPGVGWDENMETCAIVAREGVRELYYSGYPVTDEAGHRGPAALGLMTSPDGSSFTRDPDAPILEPIPAGRDGDDIFSAVALARGDETDFVYVGWCVDGYNDELPCDEGPAIQLLGATRHADGSFTRNAEPVMAPTSDPPWLSYGVAEPDVVLGPDGSYYLFMTGGLADDEPRVTGVAVGPTPFGPWELNPEPILGGGEPGTFDACGAFAPSVLIEDDLVRTWYLGIDDCEGTCPSCDFGACGCASRFTIGYAEAPWPIRRETP